MIGVLTELMPCEMDYRYILVEQVEGFSFSEPGLQNCLESKLRFADARTYHESNALNNVVSLICIINECAIKSSTSPYVTKVKGPIHRGLAAELLTRRHRELFNGVHSSWRCRRITPPEPLGVLIKVGYFETET